MDTEARPSMAETRSDTSHSPSVPVAAESDRVVVVNKLPAEEVARVGLVVLGLGIAAYFLWVIHEVLFLLALAILLATAIDPLVNRLRRGPFGRGSGVLVVYAAIIVAIGLPLLFLAPSLIGQADAFAESLPQRVEALRPYAEQLRPRQLRDAAVTVLGRVGEGLRNPAAPAEERLVEVGAIAAETVVSLFTVFVLAFYWLVERAHIKRAILRMVPPRRAKDVNAVWLEVEDKFGGWVRGQAILMLTMSVMASVGFFLIGLPNPILLGVVAGLGELVPLVGPLVAFTPAVLVALTIDPFTALVVILFATAIQQFEGNILVPRIMGRTVGVSPLAVLLGILAGWTVYGLPGAFVAVPIAGAVQVILAHALHMEDYAQMEAHSPPVARDAAAHAPSAQQATKEAAAAHAPTT